jgi:hypothetical protein
MSSSVMQPKSNLEMSMIYLLLCAAFLLICSNIFQYVPSMSIALTTSGTVVERHEECPTGTRFVGLTADSKKLCAPH